MTQHALLLVLLGACNCDEVCPDDARLIDGVCVARLPPTQPHAKLDGPCTPGERFCHELRVRAECNAAGDSAQLTGCTQDEICVDGNCTDGCTPGSVLACDGELSLSLCGSDGQSVTSTSCPIGTLRCLAGECRTTTLCPPSSARCSGSTLVSCAADGWSELEALCPIECIAGQCSEEVLPTFDYPSEPHLNREFIGVHLPGLVGTTVPYVLAIANPNQSSVLVNLETGAGQALPSRTIGYDEIALVELPALPALSAPGRSKQAVVRISSEQELAVYQHKALPLDSFSADASMLLSVDAADTEYIAISSGRTPLSPATAPYVVYVATRPGTTHVRVSSSVAAEGPDGVRIDSGKTATFALEQFEAISVKASEITGMLARADQPILAFTAHECAQIPVGNPACDHIEEQLVPLRLWTRQYVVAPFFPRGTAPDMLRVVAADQGTLLTTEPVIAGLDGVTLGAGEFVDVLTDQAFVISGSGRFLLSQFMIGSFYQCASSVPPSGCAIPVDAQCTMLDPPGIAISVGDPAQLLVPPEGAWKSDHFFPVLEAYRFSYITVVAKKDTSVELDGLSNLSFQAIAESNYVYAYLPVGPGRHRVHASEAIGVSVYAYDCVISYAFNAGFR